MEKRISKLVADFRHGHLVPLVGFRVDLHEDGNEWGRMDESICFEVKEATKEKLKIKLWHIIYQENRGDHTKESCGEYEIDLTAPYNERNATYVGGEVGERNGKKRKTK